VLSGAWVGSLRVPCRAFQYNPAEYLTTSNEYDNNGAWRGGLQETPAEAATCWPLLEWGSEIPPGEDGMDFEKDNFEDDNELSRLEDEEELGGEAHEIVETEEEELAIVGEEPEEEAPAPKPAPRPAARKPAKVAKKKAAPKKKKKAKKSRPKKKAAKKRPRKAAKRKKRR
jgi:hypothetical protein